MTATIRLTQYAHGGGCACKIPPGELETLVRGLIVEPSDDLLVGLDSGDDAAVVRIENGRALVLTTDFFTPVVDNAYDWGRIAAANALSDVYAMGGRPVVAVNLLGWPRDVLPFELAANPFAAPATEHLAELGLGPRELGAAVRAGALVRIAEGVVLLPSSLKDAVATLGTLPQPFTVSQARQALDTTRRVAVPLLELLDKQGFTLRLPDDRRRIRQ